MQFVLEVKLSLQFSITYLGFLSVRTLFVIRFVNGLMFVFGIQYLTLGFSGTHMEWIRIRCI